jgi:hypothetical protein
MPFPIVKTEYGDDRKEEAQQKIYPGKRQTEALPGNDEKWR